MLFKGIIKDDLQIREFIQLCLTLAKLDKRVIFNVQPDKLLIFTASNRCDLSPIVWCEINQHPSFAAFNMKGHDVNNPAHNQIFFAVDSTKLSQVLAGLQKPTKEFKMRLSNRPFNCFAIDTELSRHLTNHRVSLNLPIAIVPIAEWDSYQLPLQQDFDIELCTPNLRLMRGVTDAMRNLGSEVSVNLTAAGEMALISEQMEYTTTTLFKRLQVVRNGLDDAGEEIPEASCTLSTKRLHAVLSSVMNHLQMRFAVKQDFCFKAEFEVRNEMVLKCVMTSHVRDL